MIGWFLPVFLLVPLLMPFGSAAAQLSSPPALDPVLLQKLATNSIDVLALGPMPVDQKVNYALALAGFWLERRDASKARVYFEFVVDMAGRNGMKKKGQGWFGSAVLADRAEDLPSSLDRITKAEGLFKEAGEKDLLREAMFFKAGLQHRRGTYAASLRTYTEIQALSDGPHADLIKAECLSEIALLNYKMGFTNAVTPSAEQALRIFEANKQASGAADCLKILGNQAGAEGRTRDAMGFYERAAAKYKESGDLHGQANCLYNMGVSFRAEKDYSNAVARLQDAVAGYTRSASITGVGIANMELGRTYFLTGDLPKAEATLDLAKSLLTRSQDLCRLGETEGYLADLKVAQGNQQEAVAHHKTAIRLYEQAGLGDRVTQERRRLQETQSPPESPPSTKGADMPRQAGTHNP